MASDGGTTVTFRVPVPPAAAPHRPRAAPGPSSPAGTTSVATVAGTAPPVLG